MLPQISSHLLRIPSVNGSPVNEYRIHNGQIWFRALDSLGQPLPYTAWRELEPGDLELHFVLDTKVARWLLGRLGSSADSHRIPLDST